MSQLAVLQQIAEKAADMARSAREGAWERLAQQEAEEAALTQELLRLSGPDATSADLAPAKERMALIRDILACHDEIRSLAIPWQEHAQVLLQALSPRAKAG